MHYDIRGENHQTAGISLAPVAGARHSPTTMSTTHGQPGLSSDQRSDIRRTILSARHTLEDEIRRQLGLYGIHEDGRQDLESLSHLSVEQRRTREKIDAALERELESTEGDLERSITNYVREATKTYLNRFVALKAIEVRDLVEETITERTEYGNRSYVHYTVDEIAGELTDAGDDGYGAALDIAYEEIGAEIQMLFEESDYTAIDLDPQVREEVLDSLEAIDDEAWASDEALGWVYQYFGEHERDEIDERVNDENYKIAGTDIATKTQLFTPRYIVEWMVDNSLGRTWLEMQGEATNIDDEDNCFYLAPLEESLLDREEKPVEEITVLDPACGSGHMLFYAFDVLYRMYLEEGEVPEAYIPREILTNNLYGIDIDSGAAQIAALSLYLKAKERSPDVTIPQLNIVSADAVLINGDRKQEVLDRARSELEEEILEQIWRSFDNIREFGSLVRVEERIDEILEEYRQELEATGQVKFTQDGAFQTQTSVVSVEGQEETWEQVKERLLEEVSDLASEALERNDPIEEMFAGEVGKTVELLDLLVHEYDVVVSNPPYLSSRKMGDELKSFLKDNYSGYRNSYTCFIERCAEMSQRDGYATLVTPEDFMTLYSFRKLRDSIISDYQFVEGAHLSRYGFDQQKDVYTIPFVVRNRSPEEFETSRFYRMTHEQDEYETYDDKIRGLEEITNASRNENPHDDVYVVNQNSFTKIDRQPFVYWFGQEILQLFLDYEQLGEVTDVVVGLQTGDDDRFTRTWWEVPNEKIGDEYKWLFMSGDDAKYYSSPERVVYWENDGQAVKEFEDSHPRNTDFYDNEGVTFRRASKRFTSRVLSEEQIFSFHAHFVNTGGDDKYRTVGYLSSSLVRFILQGLNPGLDFNVGDGRRIPIGDFSTIPEAVGDIAKSAIEAQKSRFELVETKPEFDPELFIREYDEILRTNDLSDSTVELAHGTIDELVFERYDITEQAKERVLDENPFNLSTLPVTNPDHLSDLPDSISERLPVDEGKTVSEDEVLAVLEEVNFDLREAAERLGVSPASLTRIRREYDLYSEDEKRDRAERFASVLLGSLFGRWDLLDDELQADEILVVSSANSSSASPLKSAMESLFDRPDEMRLQVESNLGSNLEEWVRNRFFSQHHCKQYRRRGQRNPIYWQLESPNGAFSCFVYYHGITANTLPKLRGQYLDPRIDELRNELDALRAQTSGNDPDKELLERREEVERALDDVEEFRDRIDRMIDDGVSVDVEDGIWENIKVWDQYEVLQTGLPKLKSSYSR